MKTYFLNPPYLPNFGRGARWQDTGRAGTLYYPIWLSYAAALLETEHDVRLVDAPGSRMDRKDVIADVKRHKPSMVVLDSSFPSLANDLSVAEDIKKEFDTTVVFVGPPTSQVPDRILRSPGVDAVARWEYDYTLMDLAEVLDAGVGFSGVLGLSYKEDGKIVHNPERGFTSSEELERIPFVSKVYSKHLDVSDYFLGQSLYPEVQIFTGRGCPNQCTFCAWPQTLMGRKYRVRSVPNVLDEMEWIEENLPQVKEVFFEDDTFTIDKKRVLEFAKGYKERGLDVAWACNARATLGHETMKAMKKAGCRLLIVGYESGSRKILENIKKGVTVEQMRSFAQNARKADILVHGDFIVGLPGETKETISETRKMIAETRPDILQVSVASPFPGTEFYDWCKRNKFLLTENPDEYLDDCGHQKTIISYPSLSSEEIVREVDGILKSYYLSPKYLPLAMRQVLRRNGMLEMKRLVHSARMFLGYIGGRGS